MSKLQTNLTSLQAILDSVNSLPQATVAENLDEEISTQEALISEQDAKIAELAQVLAGKAGSSGESEIETCTVNISTIGKSYGFGSDSGTIIYTTVEDGKMVHKRLDGSMTNLSINVVCNSFFIIDESGLSCGHEYHGLELLAGSSFNGFVFSRIRCFHVTASAGETASLIIEID